MSKHLQAVLGLAAFALAGLAQAQAFPTKPVHLVVGFPPGGIVDITARLIGARMQESLGQPFVIENRAGAGGSIGTDFVAKAPADGHTLLMAFDTHAVNPHVYKKLPFDTFRDFAPVSTVGRIPLAFVANAKLPANNINDLVKMAKARPGGVAYGSVGAGSSGHLAAEQFKLLAGIDMLHVPYKGGAPAILDTVGGQTQMFVTAGTQSLPHVKAGKLKLLAVTENKRSALLKDTPTVAETIPGYEMAVWYGAFGPKGMPPELTARLNTEINRIMMLPDVRAKMEAIGVEAVNVTPEQFAATLRADAEKWGRLVKELNIKSE